MAVWQPKKPRKEYINGGQQFTSENMVSEFEMNEVVEAALFTGQATGNAIASATELPAGNTPTVTVGIVPATSDSTERAFNFIFGIPKGKDGDSFTWVGSYATYAELNAAWGQYQTGQLVAIFTGNTADARNGEIYERLANQSTTEQSQSAPITTLYGWAFRVDLDKEAIRGIGIQSITVAYAQSTSGTVAPTTGWLAMPPAPVAGQFLWTRNIFRFTDGAQTYMYNVVANGTNGTNGTNGRGIVSTNVVYSYNSSGTIPPTTWWTGPTAGSAGQWQWTRMTTTYTDNTTSVAYIPAQNGNTGATGQTGANGITPTIGANGNWFLGATDTGQPARGQTGATGPAGWGERISNGFLVPENFEPIPNEIYRISLTRGTYEYDHFIISGAVSSQQTPASDRFTSIVSLSSVSPYVAVQQVVFVKAGLHTSYFTREGRFTFEISEPNELWIYGGASKAENEASWSQGNMWIESIVGVFKAPVNIMPFYPPTPTPVESWQQVWSGNANYGAWGSIIIGGVVSGRRTRVTGAFNGYVDTYDCYTGSYFTFDFNTLGLTQPFTADELPSVKTFDFPYQDNCGNNYTIHLKIRLAISATTIYVETLEFWGEDEWDNPLGFGNFDGDQTLMLQITKVEQYF